MQINKLLKPLGIEIKKTSALRDQKKYYEKVINGLEGLNKIRIEAKSGDLNTIVEGLVFSKDRAMQLHALLISYFQRTLNSAPLTVLYKASGESFKNSYNLLITELAAYPVAFIEENNFYRQVCDWVCSNKADRIFFLTDDAIIVDKFDMEDVLQFDPLQTVFSLTKGENLTFCFNYNRLQRLPDFDRISNRRANGESFLQWCWADMAESPDWSYPLSLDGTFFSRKEMEVLVTNTSFRNPNTMEANLQVFVQAFLPRTGACYRKAKYVNIPCNLVQTEVANRTTTAYTIEELNEIWHNGKRIDTSKFWRQDPYTAQNMKFDFK